LISPNPDGPMGRLNFIINYETFKEIYEIIEMNLDFSFKMYYICNIIQIVVPYADLRQVKQ